MTAPRKSGRPAAGKTTRPTLPKHSQGQRNHRGSANAALGELDTPEGVAAFMWERGFHVLKAQPNTKHPFEKEWPKRRHASAAAAAAYVKGWKGNLAVTPGPGYLIVDLDVKNGKDGIAEFAKLCKQAGVEPPPTLTVKTPNGGLHLYFKLPEGAL